MLQAVKQFYRVCILLCAPGNDATSLTTQTTFTSNPMESNYRDYSAAIKTIIDAIILVNRILLAVLLSW